MKARFSVSYGVLLLFLVIFFLRYGEVRDPRFYGAALALLLAYIAVFWWIDQRKK